MAPSLPYHVYLDLDVVNNDFSSITPPPLKFEENRNAPFLDGSSADYFCSIVRFSIQTGNSLPVFIPKLILQQQFQLIQPSIKLPSYIKRLTLHLQSLLQHIQPQPGSCTFHQYLTLADNYPITIITYLTITILLE